MRPDNLFTGAPGDAGGEVIDELIRADAVRIERIVSRGHSSPDGFWYDQAENEWVVLLAGAARLGIEGEEKEVALRPGDHVNIPAHTRHRVAWTDPDLETVWLAVFY